MDEQIHFNATYNYVYNCIFFTQGTDDEYLEADLLIDNFVKAANESKGNKLKTQVFYEEGYDHGYYFISTFMGEHFKFHSSKLSK